MSRFKFGSAGCLLGLALLALAGLGQAAAPPTWQRSAPATSVNEEFSFTAQNLRTLSDTVKDDRQVLKNTQEALTKPDADTKAKFEKWLGPMTEEARQLIL